MSTSNQITELIIRQFTDKNMFKVSIEANKRLGSWPVLIEQKIEGFY